MTNKQLTNIPLTAIIAIKKSVLRLDEMIGKSTPSRMLSFIQNENKKSDSTECKKN